MIIFEFFVKDFPFSSQLEEKEYKKTEFLRQKGLVAEMERLVAEMEP